LLAPIEIKQFEEDKNLPNITQNDISTPIFDTFVVTPTSSNDTLGEVKKYLSDSRQHKLSQKKELQELVEVIEKVSQIGQKKESLKAYAEKDQKIEEMRIVEREIELIAKKRVDLEKSLQEIKSENEKLDTSLKNIISSASFHRLEGMKKGLDRLAEMGFERSKCFRIAQRDTALIDARTGEIDVSRVLEILLSNTQ